MKYSALTPHLAHFTVHTSQLRCPLWHKINYKHQRNIHFQCVTDNICMLCHSIYHFLWSVCVLCHSSHPLVVSLFLQSWGACLTCFDLHLKWLIIDVLAHSQIALQVMAALVVQSCVIAKQVILIPSITLLMDTHERIIIINTCIHLLQYCVRAWMHACICINVCNV